MASLRMTASDWSVSPFICSTLAIAQRRRLVARSRRRRTCRATPAAACSSPADICSTGLAGLSRLIDPVVIWLCAHPRDACREHQCCERLQEAGCCPVACSSGLSTSERRLHLSCAASAGASQLQKYSVNPNGWLRSGATRLPTMEGSLLHADRIRGERRSRRSLPVHLVAKDRLADAGLDKAAARLGRRQTASPARPAAYCSCLVQTARCRGALFGLGKGDDEYAALGVGALATALPEGDWHFAVEPEPIRRLRRSAWCSAAMLHALRQESRQARFASRCRRRRRGAMSSALPTPSS